MITNKIQMNTLDFYFKNTSLLYLFFGCNEFTKPSNNYTLPNFDYYEFINIFSAPIIEKLYINYIRIQGFSIYSLIFTFVFYLFLFILILIFSQKQPLKARGIIPFISLFINFFMEFNGIDIFLSFETRYYFNFCYTSIRFIVFLSFYDLFLYLFSICYYLLFK